MRLRSRFRSCITGNRRIRPAIRLRGVDRFRRIETVDLRLFIRLDGPSVRTLHLNLDEAMKEGPDQDPEVAKNFRNSHWSMVATLLGTHKPTRAVKRSQQT